MRKITRSEWDQTPEDYKGHVDGVPHKLFLEVGVGTVSAPVEIVEDKPIPGVQYRLTV